MTAIDNIYKLRKEIEGLIDKYFPAKKLILIPADIFWCDYLTGIKGVYVFCSKKKFLYIGESSNLGQRLRAHFGNPDFKNEIDSILILRLKYKDWESQAAIEAYLIDKLKPLHNKQNQHLKYYPIPPNFDLSELNSQLDAIYHGNVTISRMNHSMKGKK